MSATASHAPARTPARRAHWRRRVAWSRIACALVCVAALAGGLRTARADVAVPALSAHVTDLTGTLATPQREALENKLVALEQRKGAQIAVLILPSTQPETIEQFSIRVFDAWQLGRKGVDDGALLVVAKGDRKVRIEVGRGLEGAIPDVIAHRIIDEYLTPRFRQGDFNGGIDAATDALQKLVDGEALPAPYRNENYDNGNPPGPVLFILWLVVTVMAGGLFGELPRAVRVPLVGVGVGWLMHSFFAVAAPMFLVAGLASALIVFFMRVSSGRWSSGGGSGGWSSGSSGGGWSSGSSSSSGWSGGGGSSAGGGASGSW